MHRVRPQLFIVRGDGPRLTLLRRSTSDNGNTAHLAVPWRLTNPRSLTTYCTLSGLGTTNVQRCRTFHGASVDGMGENGRGISGSEAAWEHAGQRRAEPRRPPGVLHETSRRCDNPSCDYRMPWTDGRGRPSRFCSDRCRQRSRDDLVALQAELSALREQEDGPLTYRERRALRSQAARVEWLISAFPRSIEQHPAGGRQKV